MHNIGDRVGAILRANDKVVDFLGYGVYLGDEIPPENAGGFNFGIPNPKIKLDNGDIVWGCECWWGSQAKIERQVSTYGTINIVSIHDARKR